MRCATVCVEYCAVASGGHMHLYMYVHFHLPLRRGGAQDVWLFAACFFLKFEDEEEEEEKEALWSVSALQSQGHVLLLGAGCCDGAAREERGQAKL